MNKGKASLLAYRLDVGSRVIAAAAGGYLLVNLLNMALAFLLPTEINKALLTAMMLSFFFYTGAIIWAFAARTASRAWLGLLVIALPLTIINITFYFQGPAI